MVTAVVLKIENRKTMSSEMKMKSGKKSRVGGGRGGMHQEKEEVFSLAAAK